LGIDFGGVFTTFIFHFFNRGSVSNGGHHSLFVFVLADSFISFLGRSVLEGVVSGFISDNIELGEVFFKGEGDSLHLFSLSSHSLGEQGGSARFVILADGVRGASFKEVLTGAYFLQFKAKLINILLLVISEGIFGEILGSKLVSVNTTEDIVALLGIPIRDSAVVDSEAFLVESIENFRKVNITISVN